MNDHCGFLLIVDDEEMNRDMLSRRLELEGYCCLTAAGGADALRLLTEHDFDAVLLDAMMPVLSGYDVLAEIRKTRTAMELPVLMVTAKNQNEDVVNAFEVGANDYITKPINFPVAVARIKSHVAGKKLATRSQADANRNSSADPLTGLSNRVSFLDHLNTAVAAAPTVAAHFAVLFLDVDRFKVVNDGLGHLAGDELLITVARRLESCLRGSDVVGRIQDGFSISRFGGDEFVILLQGLHQPADAGFVADRILAVLAQPLSLRGHDVTLSASIGIALGGESDAEALLRDADTALYRAKVEGKCRWRMFDQALRKQAVERLALEQDLKKGLERGEFMVHYQPIVELPSGRIRGFEALLRWKHAVRGFVSPGDFIPLAEEIGLIGELGTWILRQACRQVRVWHDGHPESEPMFISVNVSTKQFADPNLVRTVEDCLRETGLAPPCLKLEVTESAIVTDPTAAADTLNRLRELGVHISLDDFGTGYSSLSYLQNFKIDTLKIDRSFISRMGSSTESDQIVRTIINLAHNLGMEVTAEGIEDDLQHSQLYAIGCETAQGFLYSRPISAASIEELLQEQSVRTLVDSMPGPASGTSNTPETDADLQIVY